MQESSTITRAVKLQVRLSRSLRLSEYPSGSAVTFFNRQWYITGDDAVALQILDMDYRPVRSVRIEEYPAARIPKPLKPDYECSVLVHDKGQPALLVMGSAATDQRRKLLLLPLSNHEHTIQRFDTTQFITRLQHMGIREVNLEGVACADSQVILANRGNLGYPENHFIITDTGFWRHQETAPIRFVPVQTKSFVTGFAGLSDLCYVPERDLLLLCFSSEQTTNVYDDGAIGLSYLGWISGFSACMRSAEWPIEEMISLPALDPAFRGQKIEGIHAVPDASGKLTICLVADNDTGDTGVFELVES